MNSSSKPRAPHLGRSFIQGPASIQRIWQRGIEWVAGLGGAFFIVVLFALVNLPHGVTSALMAGTKQAIWTGLMAGLLTRFCRYLCTQTSFHLLPPMWCAVLGPSSLAVLGVTAVHHLDGTANPWGSVLVTAILAPPGFWMIAYNVRRVNHAV